MNIFSSFFRLVFVLAGLGLALLFLYNEGLLVGWDVYSLADPTRQLEVFRRLLSEPLAWILFLAAVICYFIGERQEPKV